MFTRSSGSSPNLLVEDDIVVLHGVAWADYRRFIELRGDRPVPRLAYLDGVLEARRPSRAHEGLRSVIGRLVTVWCLERHVAFSVYGSWTLENKDAEAAVEPDDCYVFGEVADPVRPDLGIEVVWTREGIRKLDVYARLGVREVWYWRSGRLSIHALRDWTYEEVTASDVLPGIDPEELGSFIDRPTTSQAMREYEAHLRAKS